MNGIKNTIIFLIGAAVGGVVVWQVTKDYYEKDVEERVESVKKRFHDKKRYGEIIRQYTGSKKKECDTDKKEETVVTDIPFKEKYDDTEKPYVISPDEFGEYPDYEQISLTYYKDHILTDDADNIIEEDEMDEVVGRDAVNHFGEYEDDSVFVRNDRLKCDYEILLDLRTYAEFAKTNKPWLFKDEQEERSDE